LFTNVNVEIHKNN